MSTTTRKKNNLSRDQYLEVYFLLRDIPIQELEAMDWTDVARLIDGKKSTLSFTLRPLPESTIRQLAKTRGFTLRRVVRSDSGKTRSGTPVEPEIGRLQAVEQKLDQVLALVTDLYNSLHNIKP